MRIEIRNKTSTFEGVFLLSIISYLSETRPETRRFRRAFYRKTPDLRPTKLSKDKNLMDCDDELLELFAETAKIEDSSAFNYFRGEYPNGEVFDIEYIHYDI